MLVPNLGYCQEKKKRNRRGVLHNGISKIKAKDVINKMISVNKAQNFIKI